MSQLRLAPSLVSLLFQLFYLKTLISIKTEAGSAPEMGVYVVNSDLEPRGEKAQTTTGPKQSLCPFVLFRRLCRNHRAKREQNHRAKIDEMREQVNKTRKKVDRALESPWQRQTSTEKRHVFWERALDSDTFDVYGFKYSQGVRYRMIVTYSNGRVGYPVTHDYSTPQVREEALKWWDKEHRRRGRAIASSQALCDAWEYTYKRYTNQHHSGQREILLRGAQVSWMTAEVETLPI